MSKSRKIDIQLRVCVDAVLVAKIENACMASGYGQSEVIRAAIMLGLPALMNLPGMIPLLQPGILRESPE